MWFKRRLLSDRLGRNRCILSETFWRMVEMESQELRRKMRGKYTGTLWGARDINHTFK